MPWMKWLPWRYLFRRAARSHGFIDPVALLAHLHRFAQPSEVEVPLELLRAGMVFHARGLVNSRVIQHNLDWVWPYWIERQFDPDDVAFIPRAFTITHVNVTHRNWTGVGVPDLSPLAIVDPRGLFTPLMDGWSLDCWLLDDEGRWLLPSRLPEVRQHLEGERLAVVTEGNAPGLRMVVRACMEADEDGGGAVARLRLRARSDVPGWAVISLRPVNPEGISFVHRVSLSDDRQAWDVDGHVVRFDARVDRHRLSTYRAGDVYTHLATEGDDRAIACDVGMATAASMFRVEAGREREIEAVVRVPHAEEEGPHGRAVSWAEGLRGHCRLQVPDPRYEMLWQAALQSLVIHSPLDVYPGPYTYKRFWYRDAAFIIHALLCAGLTGRSERALDRFPLRQDRNGYFHSQEGEWDSNGEALWILDRFCRLTGRAPKAAWHDAIRRGGRWIGRKRLPAGEAPHAGLLPPGFSAEHLGPNDYYYWDDFWGVAGLRAAARLAADFDPRASEEFAAGADDFSRAIDRSLDSASARLGRRAMPAAPYRRLDAGAIGSIAAGYPLQLFEPRDERLLDSVEFLLEDCFHKGGFFQDMIHSGINPYLTLHVAQVLLRAGDARHLALTDRVAELASSTGQWPEAIHPHTLGGCMGDGHHVWASAEWVLMVRNMFVREEGGGLVIGAGVAPRWLRDGVRLAFGPAPTDFGIVSIAIEVLGGARVRVRWEGAWRGAAPAISVRLPGSEACECGGEADSVELSLEA